MASYGLLRVTGNHGLQADQGGYTDTQYRVNDGDKVEEFIESGLIRHIRRHWEINRNAKLRVEEGLLEDLRARNGEYHPQKLRFIREQGGSEIYMMITATKQRAAASWIKDILMPEDDKAWGIDPTPVPELPKWAEDMVAERVNLMLEAGEVTENQAETKFHELRAFIAFEMGEQARISAENMEAKIEDQLAEAKWHKVMAELIDDFCTFAAAIMKGPQLKRRKSLKWKQDFGKMKPVTKEELRPEFERVSPFDLYPSPQAEDVNDGHLIEHLRFERGELYNMIKVPGYKESEIRGVLMEYREGLREWLWSDTERNENENKHHWWRDGQNGLIDGLHYWGSVQGSHLVEWGIDQRKVPDLEAEYQIDAILIGNYVIRCEINNDPLARRPYYKACYDPIPSSFWGNSIRYLMADHQELCNATARALVNNMAIASGPQVEVNYERLSPLEDALNIYPWKVWQTKGAEVGGGQTVQFFQPDSNAQELMAVYNTFEIKADDATSIPRYSHGNENVGGAGTTASGLSMLMNSAAKGIKAAIANFDFGLTRPAIEMIYFYNMITTKDPSIQGDVNVVARGANALLLRDMAQMRRNEFLALTGNPIDMEIIGQEGRSDILRAIAKDFDLEGIVPSKDVIRRRMQELKENPPPSPEEIKMQGEAQIEQIKQEGEASRVEIEARFKERAQQIAVQKDAQNHQSRMAEIEAKKAVELDKQARDEAMKIRMMHEETARIIERAEINAENEMEKHSLEMERKEAERKVKEIDQQEADRKAKASKTAESKKPAVEKQEPMVLNVTIDNKSGAVKKKIKINRGDNQLMEDIDVEEQPVEG